MTTVEGKKVNTRFNRSTPAFTEPVELGIIVPMSDYKFLKSYEIFTLNGNHYNTAATALTVNEDIGNEISDGYILDLNGNKIKNLILGPSTNTDAKNITQIRPAKYSAINTIDITGTADTLRMKMNDNDGLVMARRPINWFEYATYSAYNDDDQNTSFIVRNPKLINISKHANTLLCNISDKLYLHLPMSGQSTINPNFSYRFSFYFRLKGTLTITPIIKYYTNSGVLISQINCSPEPYVYSDDEDSDFKYFQIVIPPYLAKLPSNVRRMRIVLELNPTGATVFELAYPILEYSYEISNISGCIYIPESPSKFSFKTMNYSELNLNTVGKISSFDSTKLFYSALGRELYNIDLEYSIIDSTYVYQLRAIEQLNKMGYYVAIRPKSVDLPPVLIGDIDIENNSPNYDYRNNNVKISFEEIE